MRPAHWLHPPMPFLRSPFLAAILSALLLYASAPPIGWHPLGWVALTPLFLVLLRTSLSPRDFVAWMGVGWVFGFVYYGLEFAWSYHTLVTLGGMGLLHFLGSYALLVGFLALGPGLVLSLAMLLESGLTSSKGRAIPEGASAEGNSQGNAKRLGARIATVLALPLLWAGMETLWSVFPFGGVGWATLAVSQPHTWAARLLVPAGGPFALTGAMVLVNALWAMLAEALWANPRSRIPRHWSATIPLFALLLTIGAALPASHSGPPEAGDKITSLPALLVQGNRTIAELDADRNTPVTARYFLNRTLTALSTAPRPLTPRPATEPGLVIWPESVMGPGVSPMKAMLSLMEFARLFERDILLGSTVRVRGRDYNALYWVRWDIFNTSRYEKLRLVPFGEYVPAGFRWLFPNKVTRGQVDYLPGKAPPALNRPPAKRDPPGTSIRLGIALCFESTLPQHFRDAVRAGAQALVVSANDSWLPPWAVERHVALTALNALAVGRDAAFVANGGPAALLRGGRVVTRAASVDDPLAVELRLSAGETPWVRYGPIPALIVLALLALCGISWWCFSGRRQGGRFE